MYLSMTKIDMEMHHEEHLLSKFSDFTLKVKEDLPETVNRLKKNLRIFQFVAAFLVAFIVISHFGLP